jgi:hypothetical protein
VHVVVWGEGGRANECLRSVSKRTTKLFRTKPAAADRRPHKRHATKMVAARVCAPGVPKGKTTRGAAREGGGRPCLMVMHARAEGKGKTHTHHETRHRRRDHLKRVTWQACTGGGGGCGTTQARRGQGETQARLVGSTRVHKTTVAAAI